MSKDNTFAGLHTGTVASYDEAITRFGLDRVVEMRPLFYEHKSNTGNAMLQSPRHSQTVDVKTGNPLGVVGSRYRVVPYAIAFSFAEPLLAAGAKIIGGGALNLGETAILRLEAPGAVQVGKSRILNQFILRSSHDGSAKVEARSTPFFEANGVAITVDAARPLSFKHTLNIGVRIGRARDTFKRVNENWNEFQAGVQKMIAMPITDQEARGFIEQLLPSKAGGKRIENIREDIYILFKLTGKARLLPECRGTLFGLVQAVGEWADFHQTRRKSTKRSEEAAMIDARLVSDAAKKKMKGWALALWLVNNKKLAGTSHIGV